MILELTLAFWWLLLFPDVSLWYYNASNTEIVGDEIHFPGISSAGEMRRINQSIVVQDVLKNEAILYCNTQNICQGNIANLSSSAKWYFEWLSGNEYDRIGAQSARKQDDIVSIDFGEKMPDFPMKMIYPRYDSKENHSNEYQFMYESSIIDPDFSLEWNPENIWRFPAKLEPFFLGKNGENIVLPLIYEPMTVLVVLDAFGNKIETPNKITQTSTAYVSMDIFQGDNWAGKTLESRECNATKCVFDLSDEWRGRIGELLIPSRAVENLREENGTLTIAWGEKNAKIPLVLGVIAPKE